MNKIIIEYCGGAGINVAKAINSSLANLGDGFCEIKHHYLDTSINNIDGLNSDDLWKVTSDNFKNSDIAGSGGERRTNASDIVSSVMLFLDSNKYLSEEVGTFHVVVFSGAGGTGSVLGPVVMSKLRERDIPAIAIMVGDSGNGLSCKNTLNTIATLDKMSKSATKKPFAMLYYNNSAVGNGGIVSREAAVNREIFASLSILSAFLSGDNEDIDTKDMVNFIAPDKYETITINPSLYQINIYREGVIEDSPNVINIMGRTLSKSDDTPDMSLTLLQHKYGCITSENALDKLSNVTPIHLVLTGNALVDEHTKLTKTVAEYEAIMDSIQTKSLAGTNDEDDAGLVL